MVWLFWQIAHKIVILFIFIFYDFSRFPTLRCFVTCLVPCFINILYLWIVQNTSIFVYKCVRALSCINVVISIVFINFIFWCNFPCISYVNAFHIVEGFSQQFEKRTTSSGFSFISIMKWSITLYIYSSIRFFNYYEILRIYSSSNPSWKVSNWKLKSSFDELFNCKKAKNKKQKQNSEELRNKSNYWNDEKHLIEPCFGNPRLGSNMFLKFLLFSYYFFSSLHSFNSIRASLQNYSKNYIYKWIDNNSKRFFPRFHWFCSHQIWITKIVGLCALLFFFFFFYFLNRKIWLRLLFVDV